MTTRTGAPVLLLILSGWLTACVSVNKSVLDRSFENRPVAAEQVQVYLEGDEIPEHTRVALLSGEGDDDFTDESDLIDEFRKEAGKLGANAIILLEVENPGWGDRAAGALLGTEVERRGRAIAIYVPSLDRRAGGG